MVSSLLSNKTTILCKGYMRLRNTKVVNLPFSSKLIGTCFRFPIKSLTTEAQEKVVSKELEN